MGRVTRMITASGYNDLPADWQTFGVLADIGYLALCAMVALAALALIVGGLMLARRDRP